MIYKNKIIIFLQNYERIKKTVASSIDRHVFYRNRLNGVKTITHHKSPGFDQRFTPQVIDAPQLAREPFERDVILICQFTIYTFDGLVNTGIKKVL